LTWTSPCEDWLLTSLKEKLIKIGAKVASHGRYVAFQMAEVAIPRNLFADILRLIAELRPPPDAAARVKRHVVVRLRAKPTGKVRLDDNEIRFWAFATPMSAAWEQGSPCVAELALPKSAERMKFSLTKTIIRRISAKLKDRNTSIQRALRLNYNRQQTEGISSVKKI